VGGGGCNQGPKDTAATNHMVNMQSRFSKYFSEAISDKCKWITDPFHADSLPVTNYIKIS
jgi:hypothetical protein